MTNEQIDELTKAPAGVAPTSDDPEVIYLEQRCCTDTIDGRRWTTDTLCFECDDDVAPTKYIRADLVRELAEEVKRLRAENERLCGALKFYARHEHWMAVHESPDCPQKLLIANGSMMKPGNGWEEAEAALKGRVED